MTQHPQFHDGTAQELVPYLVKRPNQRFRLIELSSEDTEMPSDGDHQEEKLDLATVFAELIEAAKHVEREAPLPPTDPHEVEYRDALQEKYRKMGLHR
jgi:hypothetical protein